MKTKIHLELEIEVDFDAMPAERMTRHYPGSPAHLEINEMEIENCKINQGLSDAIMLKYESEIEEACWDDLRDSEGEMIAYQMEDR